MKKIIFIAIFVLCNTEFILAQETGPNYPAWITLNKIATKDAVAPIQDNTAFDLSEIRYVKQTTQYYDALGRPIQTISKQASPLGFDLVKSTLYDDLGREALNFLPFVSTSNTGEFKKGAFAQQVNFYNSFLTGQGETYYYGKTNYEVSPLNRPVLSMPPGNSWAGNTKGVQMHYFNNTTTDEVVIWDVYENSVGDFGTYIQGGPYLAGSLIKMITVDEEGHQVIEFKNKAGQVILKKVQQAAITDNGTGANHENWLCTYYIYDDLGNLRAVFSPKAVELLRWGYQPPVSGSTTLPVPWKINDDILNELCFQYAYDKRNRMVKKQVPGAKPAYMVYDNKDRLVLSKDANLKNKWIYILYDHLNRPTETGIWNTIISWGDHYVAAYNANTYPQLVGQTYEILTENYYDNYGWISGPGSSAPFTSSLLPDDIGAFSTDYSNWPYPREIQQDNNITGMSTGTKTKILGTSEYLYSVNFYDNRGRMIQQQSTNTNGGKNIISNQYSFSGQLLMSVMRHRKEATSNQTFIVSTRMQYDDGGRLVKVQKKMDDGLGKFKDWKTISAMAYDELGQLKCKGLGNAVPGVNGNVGVEPLGWEPPLTTLNYEYNIRGWLLGMNRIYVNNPNGAHGYFGFELGYDKPTASSNSSPYTPLYNGNIAGTTWKMKGDEVQRRYDFGYDNVNRLLKADFTQKDNSGWSNTYMNFDIRMGDGIDPLLAYDENGNIKKMQQWGFKLGGSDKIDDLNYEYMKDNICSNKLASVTDNNTDVNSKLGDFKDGNIGSDDYEYDDNGNLKLDNNKAIHNISYNHLNLPQYIEVSGKGDIEYVYDATGNKLKKIVHETGKPDKTTAYIAGFIYEDDVLQFFGHEEGRIRYTPNAATVEKAFLFDYFLKDHLGNIRMVLTEEQQIDMYPAATMETAQTTTEETFYNNLSVTRCDLPTGYPTDNTTSPNDKVAEVNGGGNKIGPSMVLKVMAGDRFNIKVSSWYKTNGATPASPQNPLPDLLAALASGIGTITSTAAHGGGATITELTNSGVLTPGVTNFLSNQSNNNNRPKAYLNWVLFDEQFKYVSSSSGAEQVPDESAFGTVPNQVVKNHVKNDLPINKSGYLYVYVSNETPNIAVFFDNLQVTHVRSPILEETSYYPFGLTMAGISSKAAGGLENKTKYNGYEFNSDFDINLYESFYRSHDPQIGRFWQLDPRPDERISLYAAMVNNPIIFNDLMGDTSIYYNNKGQPIGVINRGNGVTAVEIGNDLSGFVGLAVNAINDNKDLSNTDVAAFDALLQEMGTAYDVSSMSNFYDDNGKSVPANSVEGVPTEGMNDIKINGKSSKLYAEVQGNLVMKDGKVTVGKGRNFSGDMTGGYPSDLPGEENKVGDIHTHPIAVPTVLDYKKGTNYGGGKFTPGPSPQDQTNAGNNKSGVRNVVVDSKNIYLINGKNTITIPRK